MLSLSRHYMEVSDQLHAPAALPPVKVPWYPFDRRVGGPQSRSGRGGEEKNTQSQPLLGFEPPDHPDGTIILEYIIGNGVRGCGLDSSDLGYGPVVGFCEHGNEPSGSVKGGGFLD
jgi:hypothetical protein